MDFDKKGNITNFVIELNNTSAIKCKYINIKNIGYINASFFDFKNSIISLDIDGKYYNLTSGYRKQFSKIYKLAFGKKETLRLNILDEIEENTAFNDVYEIANILVKNYDFSSDISSNNISDYVRDFLIMLILHVKCSDFRDKSFYGCITCLSNYDNGDTDNKFDNIFDNITNSYHCSAEIHEIVANISKRFKNMSKNMLEMVYQKILSLLNIFQCYNLHNISSKSDFCIKDFVTNESKSLYIIISSSDYKLYYPYIKIIITFLINKIKNYCLNNYSKYSVVFLIDEFQNMSSIPFLKSNHFTRYIPFCKKYYIKKLNLPVISSRKDLLKECESSIIPDNSKRMWYDIPEEMYMQHEEVIIEPLFTSKIPDEEELENIKNKISILDNSDSESDDNDIYEYDDNINDERLKNLFKQTNRSSSDNKDIDIDRNKNNIEIIFHRKIIQKNMYYTPKNEKEIKDLYKIFSHGTFNKLVDHLKQKNERQGFICIITGSAGTGKTETVLQLARSCKRNIVKYDATQISTSFIGIAAVKMKEIFESYEKAVKNSKNYPILFLNEADAIFSRRIDLNCNLNQVSSIDENRTQTVLLESLENFKGIMIATTNIITNFDPAFERRFLYKIVFDKPDRNIRMKILNDKLPELNKEEIEFIVNNYDLTGAQIENISRKLEIRKVINENINLFDEINILCKEEIENCFTQVNKTIGFK